jgi:Mn-dependent DtxR family transcriptional regulator
MLLDTQILRAIARLSRKSMPATCSEIELRVAAEPNEIRSALVRLSRSSLVVRRSDEVRLTLFGLAVAVASGASPKAPRRQRAVSGDPSSSRPSKPKKLHAA